MSKSILIIDTPENCGDCPLKYFDTDDFTYCYRCVIDNSEVNGSTKDYYCPLKPMPEKIDFRADYKNLPWAIKRYEEITGHKWSDMMTNKADGWNECIDEILGGTK